MDCERCLMNFISKKYLLQHLRKPIECMCIESNKTREIILLELLEKEGIICKDCDKKYKNNYTLGRHKCKSKIKNEDKIEKLEDKINELTSIILELAKNPHIVNNTTNIKNIDIITTNNNNINITLNCLMDTSGKPIEYLLNQEDILEKILGWMKLNQKLISTYMKEKYYNIEHPENQMIRVGKTNDSIELYINGKWRNYENIRGADMILTNIGNDFGLFLEIIKENPELYIDKKKLVKRFEKDIIKPLNWGLESSDDTSKEKEFQVIKNEQGEYVRNDEDQDRIKREELQINVINHIHDVK
jgi:hypothetical protein